MRSIKFLAAMLLASQSALAGNGGGTMAPSAITNPGDLVYLLGEQDGYVQYAQVEYSKNQSLVKKVIKSVTEVENNSSIKEALSKSYEQNTWATVGK